jgi:hypothetical protein
MTASKHGTLLITRSGIHVSGFVEVEFAIEPSHTFMFMALRQLSAAMEIMRAIYWKTSSRAATTNYPVANLIE